MRGLSLIPFLLLLGPLFGVGVEVGQYDDPRDLTIKIIDPFSQENTDLLQPVVGEYDIKILPPHIDEIENTGAYDVQGLYFKQVGKFIYIDIRQPPRQAKAGAYDLFVSLKVPGQADTSNRLRRRIIYTDAATDVVLLIDNSMSMKKNDPLGLRFSACENFIRLASLSEKIENVGIVKFSGSAQKVLDWMTPSVANRKGIGRLLSSQRSGSFTNINEAFEVAAEMFEDSVATEKVAVLLTDGKNEPDRYRDTHDILQELGVKVYTVGLSENADSAQLEIISEETGGEYFEAVDDGRLMQIYNKIAQQLNEFKTIGSGQSVRKLQFPLTSYDQLTELNLYGHPKGASFVLKDQNDESVDFQLISGGKGQETTLLRLASPKAGIYTLEAKDGSAFSYDINVQSQLFMKVFPMDHKYLRGEVAHFAVSLAHRQEPVLKSDVFATLTKPDGQVLKKIQLFDDGVHGDNHADDGVYGAILPLDFSEGLVDVQFYASGKTTVGQSVVRVDRTSFRILEAGRGAKDYFLASILPLYIDLGKVKQGGLAKASLRLSFEGRDDRKIMFEPGQFLVSKVDEEQVMPWDAVTFPEASDLKPSEARVATLSIRLPTNQPLGPYSGSFIVRIGDQDLEVPIDLVVKKGDLVRVATDISSLAPVVEERETIVAPLEGLGGVPDPVGMEEEFSPVLVESPEDSSWKKREGEADLKTEPAGGDLPNSVEITGEKDPELPIDYSVSPREIAPFQVQDGDYASILLTITNHSEYGGNVTLGLDGPGQLEREEVWIEAGGNVVLGWYWEAGELELAQREIVLKVSNLGREKLRRWGWEPVPKQPPWALIYTLIILGVIGLVYGLLFLAQRVPSHGYVSVSAWGHFILVLWAFWHLLPFQFEELDLDRDLLTFEMDWEEPEERDVEVPEDEIVVKERPEEQSPDPRDMKRVALEPNISRAMKELPKLEQTSRSVDLKVVDISMKERERDLEAESMLEITPTVMSVNDRPARRAVLKKRDSSRVVSREIENTKDSNVLRRQGTSLAAPTPKPQERKFELSRSKQDQKIPEIQERKVDPSQLKPIQESVASALELKDDIQQMDTREREQNQVEDTKLKVDPLQLNEYVARESVSDNVMVQTRPQTRTVAINAAPEMLRRQLEGGVVVAAAPSVEVNVQRLDLKKESVSKIEEAGPQERVAEVAESEVALEDSPLKNFLPQRSASSKLQGSSSWEGDVSIQSVRPVAAKEDIESEKWVPSTEQARPSVDVRRDADDSWVGSDEVKAIQVSRDTPSEEEDVRPLIEGREFISRRDIPADASVLKGERERVDLGSSDSRLDGVERSGMMIGEQPVEVLFEEKQTEKVVKRGAGAVIRMEDPEPSALPVDE